MFGKISKNLSHLVALLLCYIMIPLHSQVTPKEGITVVTVSIDSNDLYSQDSGIYVEGINGITGRCSHKPVNWNNDWKKQSFVQIYNDEQQLILNMGLGMGIFGGCSRRFDQKSFSFIAKEQFGSSSINVPLFGKNGVNISNNFVLRNSGNDWTSTMMLDGFTSRLLKKMDLDLQDYKPAILYLNSEYWGLYNLREKLNEHYIHDHYRLSKDRITIMNSSLVEPFELMHGDSSLFESLRHFIETHDLSIEENMDSVAAKIDIENFVDYNIAQIYIANTDWPGNNCRYWCDNTKLGKWRWIVFDTDLSFKDYRSNTMDRATEPDDTLNSNPPWSTLFLRKMLENDRFRDSFIQRFIFHSETTFSPEQALKILYQTKSGIETEIPDHIIRWNGILSHEAWEKNVENVGLFLIARKKYALNNMKWEFGLEQPVRIHVKTAPGICKLKLNGIDLDSGKSVYNQYPNKAISINAFLNPGYSLSHWEVFQERMVTVFSSTSNWYYWNSNDTPGKEWRIEEFNSGGWTLGQAPFGYGENSISTPVYRNDESGNSKSTLYFKRNISLQDVEKYSSFTANLHCRDGAIVFVNNEEVFRINLPPGELTDSTPAFINTRQKMEEYFTFEIAKLHFSEDTNTIAVEVHRHMKNTEQMWFALSLSGYGKDESNIEIFDEIELNYTPTTNTVFVPVLEELDKQKKLLINEIMASNINTVYDENGDFDDYLEIYNPNPLAIDLSNYSLSNKGLQEIKFVIEGENTVIQAFGHKLFWMDNEPEEGYNHCRFKLNKEGGTIALYDPNENLEDVLIFNAQESDIAFARVRDGDVSWALTSEATPGFTNTVISNTHNQSETLINEALFKVFPNPARATINIFKQVDNSLRILLYNFEGRMVKQAYMDQEQNVLSLDGLPAGIYLLYGFQGKFNQSEVIIKH